MTTQLKPTNLLRANIMVAFGTFLSRITGFARILLLATVLGFSGLSDVYNTANTTPNIIYELMLGGILSATLLPVFVRQFAGNDAVGMSAVISVISLALLILTVIAMLCAPYIIGMYAVNRGADKELFISVGTTFALCFLPQIFFYGVISLTTAILNARHKFAAPAYVPVLNNLIVIAVIAFIGLNIHGDINLQFAADNPWFIWLLGLGTSMGIVVSAVILIPQAIKVSLKLSFKPDFRNESVQKVLKLSGWTLGYVFANQVALYFITTMALGVDGGVSAYHTAFTFFLLPHALFAVSIMSTFSPDLARSAAAMDFDAHKAKIIQGVRILCLLMLPASIGYALISVPLVDVLLGYGRFDAADQKLTSSTLAFFALGLLPFSLYLFMLRSFYAFEDTKTAFYINVFENIINIILAIPLLYYFGIAGLALAYSVAYLCAAIITGYIMSGKLKYFGWARIIADLFPIFAAVATMAVAVITIQYAELSTVFKLFISIIIGGVTYLLMLLLLKVEEITALIRIIRRKSKI